MRNLSFLLMLSLFYNLVSPQAFGMVKCPFCHFENEDGALFCEQCRSDLGMIQAGPGMAGPMAVYPGGSGDPELPPVIIHK